ncbi:MAG: argininosuccinate synthase [Gemmatimonadota bacterium]|nr:argininosuccinate synthase [Gemmatimonadota bacterium]MDH3422219.1 argininosuccinate synthase [Gemmatimonadota bacterium]
MKVVLGYSGGLDTSVIVPWLKENYDADVVCMAGDVGQHGGLVGLEDKAIKTGASAFFGEDLQQEFVEDFAWPTLKIGAVYGRKYLLGTAIARPLLARRQVEIARKVGADALAHGCTGKGNDQVRFELAYVALAPDLDVIVPWREWDIQSREDALEYARARNIPLDGVDQTKLYSRDENLWHISHEGGPLEDPAYEAEESMYRWTVAPEDAPNKPEYLEVGFEAGVPVSVDGEALGGVALLRRLNEVGSRHGVGRADIVENRLVGMKSRGVYETPGGTILHAALKDLESITIDRRIEGLKDQMATRWADMLYEGRWWTPEREAIQAMSDVLSKNVTGSVRVKLYKSSVQVVSRQSPVSLYRQDLASFGDAASYDQADAAGFIRLFGLPIRAAVSAGGGEEVVSGLIQEVIEAGAL